MEISAISSGLCALGVSAQPTTRTDSQTNQAAAASGERTSSLQSTDGFSSSSYSGSDVSGTVYTRADAAKGLSTKEVQELTTQQLAAYSQMISTMASAQLNASSNSTSAVAGASSLTSTLQGIISSSGSTSIRDLVSSLQVSSSDVAAAQDAVSADGEWGVDSVASNIVDMAVSLSGGDASKFETLRSAVIAGYQSAAQRWGVDDISQMPSITTDTYNEVMNRFDYLESNGSMVGYVYGQTNIAEDNS